MSVPLSLKAAKWVNPVPTLASSSPELSRKSRAISELPTTNKSFSGNVAIALLLLRNHGCL